MYRKQAVHKACIKVNNSYEGESIEQKIRRVTQNNEPIKDGAPLIYTERKEGVLPEYDIRTDKMEVAMEAMDKVSKTITGRRTEKMKLADEAKKNMEIEKSQEAKNDGQETKSVEGTN